MTNGNASAEQRKLAAIMFTDIHSKHPTLNAQHRTPNAEAGSVVRCSALDVRRSTFSGGCDGFAEPKGIDGNRPAAL